MAVSCIQSISRPPENQWQRQAQPVLQRVQRACQQVGLLALITIFLLVGPAAAQSASDPCQPKALDLPTLLANEVQCSKSADYLHALGHLLNLAGRYGEALDRLESAILLEPQRWPVHLEYALALEGSGDAVSADGLLQQLAQNPAVDRKIQQEIAGIRARRQAMFWQQPARRTIIGIATGYDDNLMGVTRYSNLELTLPSGTLPVILDRSERQRGGSILRAELTHEHEFLRAADASWRYVLLGSYRWSIEHAPADIGHLGALVERRPYGERGFYGAAQLQQIYRAGRLALWQGQVAGGWQRPLAYPSSQCRLRLGGEVQASHYPGNAIFDGRYLGAMAHYACADSGWQAQLRLGSDNPVDAERPGGRQQQTTFRLARNLLLGEGYLGAEYEHYRQRDSQGYSTLLENNAARRIQRDTWRLEYRWVAPGYSPYVAFEWLEQRANLDLFSPRNRILTAGVRRLW